MALGLPRPLAARLQTRQRRWAVAAIAVLAGTALLALAVPLPLPDVGTRDRATGVDALAAVGEEDLSAFLDTKRWGRSLREIQEEARAEVQGAGLNPALVEMGYVGLIVTGDDNAMLLRLPEGGVVRLTFGDRTPDGRTLSAIGDNSLTLKSGDGTEEVLELFPRRMPEPGA